MKTRRNFSPCKGMISKYKMISKCILKSAVLILNALCVQNIKDVVTNPSQMRSSWSLILIHTIVHHRERENFSLNLFRVLKG